VREPDRLEAKKRAISRQYLMNSLIDVRPKKSLALLLIAIILGIIATPFLTRRTRISALDLCGHAFSDIEDTGVVKLNVELSSEPYIAPENAWLKAEAGAYLSWHFPTFSVCFVIGILYYCSPLRSST
jgi:hypothetical protein